MTFYRTVDLNLDLGSGTGNGSKNGQGSRLIDETKNNQHITQPQLDAIPNQTTVGSQNDIWPVDIVGYGQLEGQVSETKTNNLTSNEMQVHKTVKYIPLAKQPPIQFSSSKGGSISSGSGSSGFVKTNLVTALPRRDHASNSMMSLLQARIGGRNMGSPQPRNSIDGNEHKTDVSSNSFSSLIQHQMVPINMDGVSTSNFSSILLQSQNETRITDPQSQAQPINTSCVKVVSETKPSSMYAQRLEKYISPVILKGGFTKTCEQENQEKIVYSENDVNSEDQSKKSKGFNDCSQVNKRKKKEANEGDEPKVIKQYGPYHCECGAVFDISQKYAWHVKYVHYRDETPEQKLLRRTLKFKKKSVKGTSENPNDTPIKTATTITKTVEEIPSNCTADTKGKEIQEYEPVSENPSNVILISDTESE